jgi:hypothetical protein
MPRGSQVTCQLSQLMPLQLSLICLVNTKGLHT